MYLKLLLRYLTYSKHLIYDITTTSTTAKTGFKEDNSKQDLRKIIQKKTANSLFPGEM